MAIEIFKLVGSIMVDGDKAKKSINDTGKSAKDTGEKFVSLGDIAKKTAGILGTVFTVKAIADFGKLCISNAEALEQTMKKTDTIFQENSGIVKEWALENERTFGLGSGTIQGFMNDIADITQGMGMAKEESIELSKGATELGVKLANWNGINAADAIKDIQSAMTGSTKGLEKYGIKINDAAKKQAMLNLGLSGTYDKLDNATKAQVIYQAALDASGNAIDYWNEGNRSMSFYMNEAKEQFGNITETIGGLFLPIAKEATSKFADMVAKANEFVTKTVEGFGVFKQTLEETGEPTTAFCEMFKSIFGFELPDSFAWMVDSIILFFQTLWDTGKEIWETVGVPIVEAIKGAFTGLSEHSDSIFNFIGQTFDFMTDYIKTTWDSVGKPIFDLIMKVVGLVRDYFASKMPEIKEFFRQMVSDIKTIWENNLKPAFDAIGNFISNVLAPIFEKVFKYIIAPIVDGAFQTIIDLWNNSLKPILIGIIDFIGGVFSGDWARIWSGITNVLSGIWEGIKTILWEPIEWFLNVVEGVVEKITAPFKKAADSISNIWSSIKSVFKLPHFTFSGSMNPLKWLDEGLPSIGVEWYAKGGVLHEPTVFGMNGPNAMVGGEAGPEAVAPIETLMKFIDIAVRNAMPEPTTPKTENNTTVNIYSPEHLSPSEVARQFKNTQRQLAYEF